MWLVVKLFLNLKNNLGKRSVSYYVTRTKVFVMEKTEFGCCLPELSVYGSSKYLFDVICVCLEQALSLDSLFDVSCAFHRIDVVPSLGIFFYFILLGQNLGRAFDV